jgi:hypothetical protein
MRMAVVGAPSYFKKKPPPKLAEEGIPSFGQLSDQRADDVL